KISNTPPHFKVEGNTYRAERRVHFYITAEKKKSVYSPFYIYLDFVPDGDIHRVPGAYRHFRTWNGSGFQRAFAGNAGVYSSTRRRWRFSCGSATSAAYLFNRQYIFWMANVERFNRYYYCRRFNKFWFINLF